jgi:hypothetical protein
MSKTAGLDRMTQDALRAQELFRSGKVKSVHLVLKRFVLPHGELIFESSINPVKK